MTPSVNIVESATVMEAVVDRLGRKLTLRRLTALDKLRLFKAAGPDLAQNEAWLGMAMLASSVIAIDDVPIPSPATEQQVEAMVGRLGEVGIAAAADALLPTTDSDPAELVNSAGNLPGTPT
jgi:hypothetical protein